MFPPQLRPTPETKAAYTTEWLEMVAEIGERAFSKALVMAVRGAEFFPVVSRLRACANLGVEAKRASEADAAWLYIQAYIDKGYACDWCTNAPALPPRIAYAVRSVGGLQAMNNVLIKNLPFMRKDFCEAWDRYEQSSVALDALMLAAPLELQRSRLLPAHQVNGSAVPVTIEVAADGKVDIAAALNRMCRPPRAPIREKTEAEVEDTREMLRQQAEKLLRTMKNADAV